MFEERLLLAEGVILEAKVSPDLSFVLSLRKGETVLVEYNESSGYEFKSVEKLRYDFERDAEDALRRA